MTHDDLDDPARWTQARGHFLDLVDAAPEARALALAELHREDPHLADFVARLLAQDDGGGEKPGRSRTTPAGRTVGAFTVLEALGEGGFGSVHRARQEAPIAREVAIKIQKHGVVSPDLLARFADERRYLERIDHPDVVKVLDAGVTEDGRLYIAMELVRGEPITEFVRREALSARERVALMARVARAVHHVHQRAILHRDLKPTNILVTRVEGVPCPRLIDFGVATVMSTAERAGWTRLVGPMCTPAYAAPEQVAGRDDVDVRVDVYALGQVLCECLTGHRAREGASPSETPARRPSGLAATAAPPQAPEPLRPRDLRGDLDRIVLRAVAWEAAERYDSAAAFADDLERYLRNEPVRAAPTSAWYVFSKLVARNRLAALAASVALLALCIGAVVAVDGRQRAERARVVAEREATRAHTVLRYLLEDLLQWLDIDARPERPLTVLELLAEAESNAHERFADDPATLAEVLSVVASSLAKSGQVSDADRLHHLALAAAERAFVAPSRQLFEVRLALMTHQLIHGGGEPEAQRARAEVEALALDDGRGRDAARVRLRCNPDLDTLREIVEAFDEDPQWSYADRLLALRGLGLSLSTAGHLEESVAVKREVLDLARERLGSEHSSVMELEGALGSALIGIGQAAEGGPVFENARARAHARFGARHSITRSLDLVAARQLNIVGARSEALELGRSLAELATELDGARSWARMNALEVIGVAQLHLDRLPESRAAAEELLGLRVELLGLDDGRTASARCLLGEVLAREGKWGELLALLEGQPDTRELGEGAARGIGRVPLALDLARLWACAWNGVGRVAEASREWEAVRAQAEALSVPPPVIAAWKRQWEAAGE